MKNASQIITSLQHKPQFSKLSKYKCISKIQSIFTPALQKMIKFAYVKNNILFFVLTHPAGKQEFDNSIHTIKSALKFYMPEECKDTMFQDIKAFVTHTPIKSMNITIHEEIQYPERSSGDFAIPVEDEKLHALIKTIQDIIKTNNKEKL